MLVAGREAPGWFNLIISRLLKKHASHVSQRCLSSSSTRGGYGNQLSARSDSRCGKAKKACSAASGRFEIDGHVGKLGLFCSGGAEGARSTQRHVDRGHNQLHLPHQTTRRVRPVARSRTSEGKMGLFCETLGWYRHRYDWKGRTSDLEEDTMRPQRDTPIKLMIRLWLGELILPISSATGLPS